MARRAPGAAGGALGAKGAPLGTGLWGRPNGIIFIDTDINIYIYNIYKYVYDMIYPS